MLKTILLMNWHVFAFGVTRFLNYDVYKITVGKLNATDMLIIAIVMIYATHLPMHYCFNIDVSDISSTVINSNYIYLQEILTSIITIFNGLLDIFIRWKQLIINCTSYYKFIHWHSLSITHSSMILHSIGEVDLIVYNIFDVVTSTFKEMNREYSPNKTHVDQIVEGQSIDKIYRMMFCMLITTSIVDIVIGITEFNNSNMYFFLQF